jgi:hypothetical protein
MENKNVVNRLKELVADFFNKGRMREKTPPPPQKVIDIVKDKRLARDILKVDAVDYALGMIEREINAKFAGRIGEYLAQRTADHPLVAELNAKRGNYAKEEQEWTRLAKEWENEIKAVTEEIDNLRHEKDPEDISNSVIIGGYGEEDEEEDEIYGTEETISPDFPSVAAHLAFLLDPKERGDVKVQDAERIISKRFYNNNVEAVRNLAQIGDSIYSKALTDKGEVIWEDKEYADPDSVAAFENAVLHLADKVCELYGGSDRKIIKFPSTPKEREKYL